MDQVLGEIRIFAGNFPPRGWALCNGQVLPIQNNDALFFLLGTTYGGDGVNTFALPNLARPEGAPSDTRFLNYLICIEGFFPNRRG